MIINYASLDFSSNHRTEYAYMLEGYNKEWMSNGPVTTATYTNLDPGKYVFKVKAINPEFIGNPQITSLPIRIIPAWYQTLLFKILFITAISALLFSLIRWYYLARLRKQRLEYEKLLAVQTERQRISAEIHDDIGAGLSGVRLLTELTKQKAENPELKSEIEKIYSSVSDLSGKMKEVIWSLNTDNDNLENLLYYIRRQGEQLFENSPIELAVQLPEQIPDVNLKGDLRRHIYLAVKEALHNTLKHSSANHCTMSINVAGELLDISVSDNGKGIRSTDHHNFSNGLRNMQKRMKQIGGNVRIENMNGTQVDFTIPLKETS